MSDVKDLIIIGAGNPDIVLLIEELNNVRKQFTIIGFLDRDEKMHGKDILGYPVLGDDSKLDSEFKMCYVVHNVSHTCQLRQKVATMLLARFDRDRFPNLIHPSVRQRHVQFGVGNIIYEFVNLAANVSMGDFNLIYPCTVIGHEASLGSCNLVAASSVVSGRSKVGSRVLIGNGAVMVPGIEICDDVIVGTGSVVLNDVNIKGTVFGIPAKPLRLAIRE